MSADKTKIKLLLDLRVKNTHPNRGISRHIDSVRSVLKHHREKFAVIEFKGLLSRRSGNSFFAFFLYVLDEQLVLPLFSFLKACDYVVFPNQTAPILPLYGNRILIIHDVMYVENLKLYGLSGKMVVSSLYRYFCTKISLAFYDTRVLTVSEASREKLKKIFGINYDTISIIPNVVTDFADHSAEAVQIHQRYMLTVTGAAEHKNFPRLCEAIQLLESSDISLVAVGNTGKIGDHNSKVVKLNDVSDSQLMSLYENSMLFVFVSLDEGFGVPLLEAMTFGKPVVCSDISVFREIMGGDAIYCNPENVHSIVAALLRCLETLSTPKNYNRQLEYYSQGVIEQAILNYFEGLSIQ